MFNHQGGEPVKRVEIQERAGEVRGPGLEDTDGDTRVRVDACFEQGDTQGDAPWSGDRTRGRQVGHRQPMEE